VRAVVGMTDAHHNWDAWRAAWNHVQTIVNAGQAFALDGTEFDCRNPDCGGYVQIRFRVGPPSAEEAQRVTQRWAGTVDSPTLIFHEFHSDDCPVHVDVRVRSVS